MRKLENCIKDFIDGITISKDLDERIDASFESLKTYLEKEDNGLHVNRVIMNGSYLRDTIIRPTVENDVDIDVFVFIDEDQWDSQGVNPKPQSVLTKFKQYLELNGDYKGKCRQDRPCITIYLQAYHIDVLPALDKNGTYKIPNNNLENWMSTDPELHTDRLNSVDTKRGGKVKPIIRAVKKWKVLKGLNKLPSFHIEEIAMDIFDNENFTTYEEGIRMWFKDASKHLKPTRFDSKDECDAVRDAINAAKDKLNKAKALLDDKKEEDAKKLWKEVFDDRKFVIIDATEAKEFSSALTEGRLKYGAAGLSTTAGRGIAASHGFYGNE